MEPKEKLIVYVRAYEELPKSSVFVAGTAQVAAACGEKQWDLQHVIGRNLLRKALFREYGIEISGELEHRIEKRTNGKPVLKGLPIHFNISHCKGLVACALAPCPVGVDVEGTRNVSEALVKRVCAQEEQEYIARGDLKERFLELWTLKESYLKMTGEGIVTNLSGVVFRLENREEGIVCNRAGNFYQEKIQPDYILSVCTERYCGKLRLVTVKE